MSKEEFTISIRKYLKHLGVTGHQVIEDAMNKSVKTGEIQPGSKISISAEITIDKLNISHKIDGSLTVPD
tara:strand:- start:1179 stop:1388 length:210 start_codon:yes stop_codon:yes gene_type:complete